MPEISHCPQASTMSQGLMLTSQLTGMAEKAAEKAAKLYQEGDFQAATALILCFREISLQAARSTTQASETQEENEETLEYTSQRIEEINARMTAVTKRADETAQHLPQLREAIPQTVAEGLHRTALAHYRISQEKAFSRVLGKFEEIEYRKANWEGTARTEYVQTLQQMASTPMEILRETGEPGPGSREPGEALEQAAREAKEKTKAGLTRALTKYNKKLGTQVSPSLKDLPELEQELRNTLLPAMGCISGFLYSTQANSPQDGTQDGTQTGAIGWTAFIHKGQRVLKTLTDPYPKGFSQRDAMIQGDQIADNLRTTIMNNEEMPTDVIMSFQLMIQSARAATEKGLHTVTREDLQKIMDTADQEGLPKGAQAAMIRGMTEEDPLAAEFVCHGHREFQHTASLSQAQAVVKAAQELGLDSFATHELAKAMGHPPADASVVITPLKVSALEQVFRTAMGLDLPQEVAETLIDPLCDALE